VQSDFHLFNRSNNNYPEACLHASDRTLSGLRRGETTGLYA
jgi:hypothetical protein